MTKSLTYVEVDVPEHTSPEFVDPVLQYDFTRNSLFSWAGSEATATATVNGATLAATGDDPQIRSPAGLQIDGSANRYVMIDVERTALRTAGFWLGRILWTTAGHGESASFLKNLDELPNVVGARKVYVLDMSDLDFGGDDWITSIITQIRFDFEDNQVSLGGTGTSVGSTLLIRSVMVGPLAQGRAAYFDGGTHFTRGAGFTGAADSKLWTISLWVNVSADGAGTVRFWYESEGVNSCRFALLTTNNFAIVGVNSADVTIFRIESAGALPTNQWNHILFSVDMDDDTSARLYINDELNLFTQVTFTVGSSFDFTRTEWALGAQTDGTTKFLGSMADFWIGHGVHMDMDDPVNRRRFISDLRSPVNLGAMGELPTGTPPTVFLSGPPAGWNVNRGSGGGFGPVGSPALLLDPGPVTETWRFAVPAAYLPDDIPCIPSIESVSFQPATISLGQNLGQRASLGITLNDHKHIFGDEPFDQGTFWGKWRGRYQTKLRGCPLRLIRGAVGTAIGSMDTRHYVIDTTEGPSFGAKYTFNAKDILKLADEDRSQAPALSNGSLAGTINAVVTAAILNPAGIGNLEYPSSGWICLGGKEVVAFTRVNDNLTITRGQFGTVAVQHQSGDRAQLVLRYTGNDPADIIQDLMVNYAGIPSAYIDLAEWQAETAANLNVIYAATITEPTSVNKLVSELIEQAALAVWWDDRAKMVRLQVLREISTDTDTFGPDRMLEGSFSVKEQPTKRISQIWTYYGQRDPTDSGANEDNFRAALATVDLELEADYGSAEIKKIQARWVETLTAATRLNSLQLSRYRDPPRAFQWALPAGESIILAGGYQLEWWGNQDAEGNLVPALVQVTRVMIQPDRIVVEAEEMLASGEVLLVNVVFLTSAGALNNWTVPASWNDADNSVEMIGGGAGGGVNSGSGARGGGAGAYSRSNNVNLTPGATVQYRVGLGGASLTDGGDTWFNGATFGAATTSAKGGTAGFGRTGGGIGGQASAGVGDLKTSGGDGGNGSIGDGADGGGGAGGAGGPHGDGGDGGPNDDDNAAGSGGGGADGGSIGEHAGGATGGVGGNNRFGFGAGTPVSQNGEQGGGGGGGTSGSNRGGDGGDGEQLWTQTVAPITSAGPGGGGGGGVGNSNRGGDGGDYGGAGGGGGNNNGPGGTGAQGIIVITWREV